MPDNSINARNHLSIHLGSMALSALLFLFTTLFPAACFSATHRILVLPSDNSEFYTEFTTTLKNKLTEHCKQHCEDNNLSVDISSLEELISETRILDNYQYVVTLGVKAKQTYQQSNHSEEQVALHALIPHNLTQHDSENNHFSLVLDQPVDRQLDTIQKLFTKTKPIGVIYTEKSEWRIEEINQFSSQLGIPVKTFKIDTGRQYSIGESLSSFLPEISVILMIPDKFLYNKITINEILLTGYLNQVPFIGYSKALAITGAMSSITTPQDNIIADIVRTVIQLINHELPGSTLFPTDYTVFINQQISDSLNLELNFQKLDTDKVEVIEE